MKQEKTEKTFGEVLKEACQNSQKSTKYSFVGRPDFNRIIRENPESEVIIVSREDGLVTFLFKLGPNWTSSPWSPNIFRRAEKDLGVGSFDLLAETTHNGPEQLPREWAAHWTTDSERIKDLRRIAQYIVRARTGKHTVEVLPA